MTIYNRLLLSLTILTALVNVLLVCAGQENLDIYFTVNAVVCLGITLLHVRLNPRARTAVDIVGCVLFGGVMVIVVVKTIHNLSGS